MRPTTHQPDFTTLPEVPGCPGLRWVDTTMMDRHEYHVSGWHVRTVGGHGYWVVALSGAMDWARRQGQARREDIARVTERVAAAMDRDEEDAASWGAFHRPPGGWRNDR